MKVNQLEGAALDWAVTKAEGFDVEVTGPEWGLWGWATDWGQGGPIIERERISVEPCFDWKWVAIRTEGPNSAFEEEGPTPLVAAMRCYVASKMGDEIEVPDELLQGEEA
jgi:hypothetical protein